MTGITQTLTGWPMRRFVWVVGFVFVLQVLLVGFLSAWRSALPPGNATAQSPALVWLPFADPLLSEVPDAAALAMVNRGCYSGPLWLRRLWPHLVLEAAVEGTVTIDGVSSVRPWFSRLQPGQPSPAEFSLLPLVPRPSAPFSASLTLLSECSFLRIDGEIRSRRMVRSGTLPAWTNVEILTPTTVQIMVDRSGGVLSATLQPPGSGLAAADQLALQRARSLGFDPATGRQGGFQWGTIEFVWSTVTQAAATAPAVIFPP